MPESEVQKYISVYGLRNYEEIDQKMVSLVSWSFQSFYNSLYLQVTELIYVHSKVMIVDDRATIIGSCEYDKQHNRCAFLLSFQPTSTIAVYLVTETLKWLLFLRTKK